MRQFATIALLLFIVSFSYGQQAKMQFEKKVHDFGTIKEEAGRATYEFKFKNTGNAPLIINHVQASCGCTTPGWDKAPIIPGKNSVIKVTFDPRNRPGNFSKQIRVLNNSESPTIILTIKGTVTPRERPIEEVYRRPIGKMRVKTDHLSFTQVYNDQIKTDSLEVVNMDSTPLELGIKRIPSHLTAKLHPKKIMPGKKGWIVVTYDANKKNAYGFQMDRIYLTQNGEGNYQYSIGTSATIMENFTKLTASEKQNAPIVTYNQKVFDFGEILEGDRIEHVFKITNDGKRNLIIRNIRTTCGCTAARPNKDVLIPGETTELKVSFNSRGKIGRQSKPITIITNDPKNPMSSIRLMGVVKRKS
ncbi:DUF1573 domain-containing protein [Prolixibacteraceae bacterium JC049]|nr:DUF1573 domain-containing protein [Prolixibacteraceae bacterium JC049]